MSSPTDKLVPCHLLPPVAEMSPISTTAALPDELEGLLSRPTPLNTYEVELDAALKQLDRRLRLNSSFRQCESKR